jgi:AcrR family transcriptional regulator
MARITDQNRIERLKKSTMQLVVEKGFGGASAALIAADAKVAAGYFYMHYHGKYEMVNSLLHDVYKEFIDKLEELIDNGSSFQQIVEKLIQHFIYIGNNEPIKVKFLYVLTNEYSFVIDKEVRQNAFLFIDKMMELGYSEKVLDPNVTDEDIYLILVINTIQFLNQRFKNFPEGIQFTKEDEDHLIYLINKILK